MTALIALALLLASPVTPRELNAAGMGQYQGRKLIEAAALFTQAIAAEPREALPSTKEQTELRRTLALAHYNLACVQSLLRARGRVCEADADRGSIVAHLNAAVERDPARLERALKDPDLAAVRDTLGYQSLLGLSPKREADLPALLARVRWWSQGTGVYGSLQQLQFFPGGAVILTTRAIDDAGKATSRVSKGRWAISGRSLTVTVEGSTWEGPFNEAGALEFKSGRFTDAPSECEA